MNNDYNNKSLNSFQNNNVQSNPVNMNQPQPNSNVDEFGQLQQNNNVQPNMVNMNQIQPNISQPNSNFGEIGQPQQNNNVQPSMVNMNQIQPNISQPNSNVGENGQPQQNNRSVKKIINKKNIIIGLGIILIIIVLFVVIKGIFSNDNENNIKVSKNQKLIECGLEVTIAGEKTKRIMSNYVLEDLKVIKNISSETYYLDSASNEITKEDISKYKDELNKECSSYPNNECEVSVDYKEGKIFKYEVTLSGSLLNELNDSFENLSEEEIINKIKEIGDKNLLSCDVK